jgi:hypothetical protein
MADALVRARQQRIAWLACIVVALGVAGTLGPWKVVTSPGSPTLTSGPLTGTNVVLGVPCWLLLVWIGGAAVHVVASRSGQGDSLKRGLVIGGGAGVALSVVALLGSTVWGVDRASHDLVNLNASAGWGLWLTAASFVASTALGAIASRRSLAA